jgi:cytochrome c peroxidase
MEPALADGRYLMMFGKRRKFLLRTTVLPWAPVLPALLATALVLGSAQIGGYVGPGIPLQSSAIALSDAGRWLVNVTNFLPVQSRGRDKRQDSIGVFIAAQVRASRAPVSANDAQAVLGRQLFGQVGLVTSGVSCATCHGGPKWTRSTIDYTAPPSTEINLGLGNQRVIGAELRQTVAQGPNVLNNVGTFTAAGRQNEIRFSAADISQAIAPLGANGFNIPSLLSVHETAPYFYSGLAQTLEEVLNGSQDSFGGTRQHFVANPQNRQSLIAFLRSIDSKTPIFP